MAVLIKGCGVPLDSLHTHFISLTTNKGLLALIINFKNNHEMTIKEVLKQLNPKLLGDDAIRQPGQAHEIYVTGVRVKGDDGKLITRFIQQSNPNAAAKAAGVQSGTYIHASFKPIGCVTYETITITDAEGKDQQLKIKTQKGPRKPQVGVVFLSNQTDLFNLISESIALGEGKGWVKAGIDSKKRPVIRLFNRTWGAILGINCPEYIPHSMDEKGKRVALSPVTYIPETGEYKPRAVTMSAFKFFADDDDLDLLAESCTKQANKNVVPYMVKKLTTIEEDVLGNRREIVKEGANATPEVPLPQDETEETSGDATFEADDEFGTVGN